MPDRRHPNVYWREASNSPDVLRRGKFPPRSRKAFLASILPSNQERCWANWGAKGSLPHIGQAHCVKSRWTIAPPARRVVCVVLRLAYDPHPIPGGLLRRRNLHRLVGIVLHVADREPLGLDLLLHFLLSHLECITVSGRLAKFSHGELQPEVFDTTSVASTCAFGCTRTPLAS